MWVKVQKHLKVDEISVASIWVPCTKFLQIIHSNLKGTFQSIIISHLVMVILSDGFKVAETPWKYFNTYSNQPSFSMFA